MSRTDNPKVTSLFITAMGQAAACDIVNTDQHRQANVYLPQNGGAALFALFDLDKTDEQISQSLVPVLRGDPLVENVEITDLVPDCIFAGTIERPVIKVEQLEQSAEQ